MTLEGANRWLALAANIGVMAGIIFLAYELRQNTVATELDAARNYQSSFSEITLFIAGNPEFAELIVKGREPDADISDVDRLRLRVFYGNVLRQWQSMHFQFLSDALDAEIWRANRFRFASLLREDRGLREHWRASKPEFSPAFNEMIESITVERP